MVDGSAQLVICGATVISCPGDQPGDGCQLLIDIGEGDRVGFKHDSLAFQIIGDVDLSASDQRFGDGRTARFVLLLQRERQPVARGLQLNAAGA